uniref:Uncharacterized protein n=1 Tax=Glossina morsitans morsitans TaxID=37546 RepID=A0A1B0FKW1_GLOMM
MKLTVFCVLLVFSCLVANVEGASWQDQFSNDNLKKAFNTVAKSFHEVGAKVSKALSGDSKKKPFKSVIQSPQNPGNKTTETPNKEESQKESNSSNQPLQNSTSNTTLAPTVAHLWRNSTSSVEILNNTDVSSADVVNEDDLVKNANSLAEIPTDAATSAAETPNKEESEKKSNSSNQPLQNSTSNTTLSPTIANLRAYLISLFDIFRNTDVSSVDVVNEEDLVKNSTSLAEIPTDAATSAAEAENLKKTSSSLAEDLNNSTASAAKVLKENSTSLPSAAETFTGDNLNKNSSSLAEILKNEAISGENLEKNGQSLDASIKVSEVVSAQNLQTIINSLAEILQNTSASIGEAISSDKENSNSLGDVLTDAGSNIAGDSNSENLTNTINSLTDPCTVINVRALEPLAGIEIDIATDSEEDETNDRIADGVENLKVDLDEVMTYWDKTSSKLSKVANDISKLSKVSGDYDGSGSSTMEKDLKYLAEALNDADNKFREAKFY